MIITESKVENKLENSKNMISLAKRLNNSKRTHLFVNKFQAKHIPCNPFELELIVYKMVEDVCINGDETLIIGFAETATAIAAIVADSLKAKYFVHTTREEIDESLNIVEFEEEHSHALEQKLFSRDKDIFKKCKNVIFVEDEISTGKTILNFVSVLKEQGLIKESHNLFAFSLVNAMSEKDLINFNSMNIEVKYAEKIQYEYGGEFSKTKFKDENTNRSEPESILIKYINGKINPRLCVKTEDYLRSVEKLIDEVNEFIMLDIEGSILVIGTEEFMYPSIKLGQKFQNLGLDVKVHSTTRSPIEVSDEVNYPLKSRNKLKSFYDNNRETFIYNLDTYEQVVIITDTDIDGEAFFELSHILANYENKNIIFVRWVN